MLNNSISIKTMAGKFILSILDRLHKITLPHNSPDVSCAFLIKNAMKIAGRFWVYFFGGNFLPSATRLIANRQITNKGLKIFCNPHY